MLAEYIYLFQVVRQSNFDQGFALTVYSQKAIPDHSQQQIY